MARPVTPRALPAFAGWALLFVLLPLGCRDGVVVPPPGGGISYHPEIRIGDRALYDVWSVDRFGYLVVASHSTSRWLVTATNQVAAGETGVIAILDSTIADSSGITIDTLFIQVRPDGSLRQYGFFSALARHRFHRLLPRRWDVLASFSSGADQFFSAGTLDSAGGDPVTGTLRSRQNYFTLFVDGQPTIVPAYRVDFSGRDFHCSLWLTEAPGSFPRILLDSGSDSTGLYRSLIDLRPGPAP